MQTEASSGLILKSDCNVTGFISYLCSIAQLRFNGASGHLYILMINCPNVLIHECQWVSVGGRLKCVKLCKFAWDEVTSMHSISWKRTDAVQNLFMFLLADCSEAVVYVRPSRFVTFSNSDIIMNRPKVSVGKSGWVFPLRH